MALPLCWHDCWSPIKKLTANIAGHSLVRSGLIFSANHSDLVAAPSFVFHAVLRCCIFAGKAAHALSPPSQNAYKTVHVFFWLQGCAGLFFFFPLIYDEGSLQNEKESMEQVRCTL